jgi:anion-transporting  ArsA/GET3 family ATPase
VTGPPLLDRRLCFVLGKGGVGKSTVAAALGLLGARAGRRTLLVEVAARRRLSRLFAGAAIGADRPTELAPGLFGLSIEAERAMEEYLDMQLKVRPLVDLLVKSRAFHSFAAAAPGLPELVTLGKIWELATHVEDGRPVWDVLVVDLPATGHGIALLEVAGRVHELAASGPIREQSAKIAEVVGHPAATGIAVVARPEELAVTEATEAVAALREKGLPAAVAVMNGVCARRFTPEDVPVLEAALAATPDGAAATAVRAALAHAHRERREQGQSAQLAEGVDLPVVELPELITARMDLDGVGILAGALGASPAVAPAGTRVAG